MLHQTRMHIFGIGRRQPNARPGDGPFRAASAPRAGWQSQRANKVTTKKAILVAEASDAFASLLRRAFAEAGVPHMLRRVRDGAEALRYVAGQEEFENRQRFPYPDLLVVASTLPKISGVELLGYLRGEMASKIPVVVFSSTLAPMEMRRVLELGLADYLVRPDVLSVLVDEVNAIERSWLG